MHARMLLGMLPALMVWPPLCSAANPEGAVAQTLSPKEAVEHIRSLIKADRLPEASRDIARQPQQLRSDPELKFLQCVVQANQKQVPQAITCFTALVKVHPDMVEAYNNLGVLHASLGHHEEAKHWFDNGLRRVPALWTVHQNILNLQADLSRKAYSRALQIEMPEREPQPRLSFLAATSTVLLPGAKPLESKVASLSSTKAPAQSASAASATMPAQPTPMPRQAAVPAPASSAPVVAVTAPEVRPPLPATAAPKPQVDESQAQVQQALQAWAKAWSDKNLPSYFAAYASDFAPSKEVSNTAWKAERTARIAGRRLIRVGLSNITFEKKSSKVTVRFTQNYESDNLLSSQSKRLDFMLEDGRWRIVRETVIGNTP